VRERAEKLIASLHRRLDAIRDKAALAPARPSVAAIEWLSPLMGGGNWMPELIEIAGGRSLFLQAGEHSNWLEWETLIESDPDVILLLPCGFKLAQTVRDLNLLTDNSAWVNLRAVKERHVYAVDGHHFFNRPGPRLVESAEIVAEILHPDRFTFGHRGTGWIRID